MQNVVCLVAAIFAEVILIELDDAWVLMRSSQRSCAVKVIEALSSDFTNIDEVLDAGRNDWLTAAVYASARASHDLDECVILLA